MAATIGCRGTVLLAGARTGAWAGGQGLEPVSRLRTVVVTPAVIIVAGAAACKICYQEPLWPTQTRSCCCTSRRRQAVHGSVPLLACHLRRRAFPARENLLQLCEKHRALQSQLPPASALPELRSGLGVHIASEKGEGVANFTDILLILSADDMQRADANFQARVTQKLSQQFEQASFPSLPFLFPSLPLHAAVSHL